jgi:hypothetical protein
MNLTTTPNSADITHDIFTLAIMAVPVLFLIHHHPLLGLAIGGFEAAMFYSLGGPHLTL